MAEHSQPVRGRGARTNPPSRFEPLRQERDADWNEPDDPAPRTKFFRDSSRSIIAFNDSPDVGFAATINPYRGCEHGCAYCYARPTHEYLGFSAGLDFETKILVKEDAPELLRRELAAPRWQPQPLGLSGVTDPYQPVERRLRLTRRCLEVLAEFRNPVGIVTKNHLVTRDLDLLADLARDQAAEVMLSITTLDRKLAAEMEPRTSPPARRLAAIEALTKAGVPTGVLIAPVIAGLTDHELPRILTAAANAGARAAMFAPLRLPLACATVFERWLDDHYPGRKENVLNRIRATHGGRLNDPRFGHRMRGEGLYVAQMKALFTVACRKAGIPHDIPPLATAAFRRPTKQLDLFR